MNPTPIGIPTSIWVVLEQGNGTPTLVSTLGCEFVDQFKKAIKKEYDPLLKDYAVSQITLIQADGMTEISTRMLLTDLSLGFEANGDQRALVVKVDSKKPLVIRSENDAGQGIAHAILLQREQNQAGTAMDIDVLSFDSAIYQTSPPPLRQSPQTYLGSTFGAASPALLKFWTAFTNYSNPLEENTVIQLPENVFILGKFFIGSSIYIRPCYPKLLKTSLSIVESAETQHLIILGNPGIGKTYFGYFLLLHLARAGATVIYESYLQKKWLYLFTPDGVFKGDHNSFYDQLMTSETFYIVDGMTPVEVNARTILLTSLRREIWHQFSKTSCDLRYMPVWSKEELFSCHSMLFSSIPKAVVENLYLKWGGIARYVLQLALVEEQQALLNQALDISNIDSVVESFGGSGAKADASSRLIHRSVRDGFHSGPYQFASAFVVDEIYSRLYVKDRDHLIRFLSATQGIGETGQLRGTLFENHAHTVLSKGGSFKIRDLQTAQELTLELPLDFTIFLYSSNDSEFQNAFHCYFRPVSKIFESVDSFIKPNLLFQMTGAKDHPCKQTGLRDVLEILGNPLKPEMYFVVPPDRFASFKYQSYHGTDGKVLSKKGIVANVRKLSQFVLTFELSPQ